MHREKFPEKVRWCFVFLTRLPTTSWIEVELFTIRKNIYILSIFFPWSGFMQFGWRICSFVSFFKLCSRTEVNFLLSSGLLYKVLEPLWVFPTSDACSCTRIAHAHVSFQAVHYFIRLVENYLSAQLVNIECALYCLRKYKQVTKVFLFYSFALPILGSVPFNPNACQCHGSQSNWGSLPWHMWISDEGVTRKQGKVRVPLTHHTSPLRRIEPSDHKVFAVIQCIGGSQAVIH